MKKFYQIFSKALIVFLVTLIPFVMVAQTEKTASKPADKTEKKADTTKKKGCEKAPSYSYWGFTGFIGTNQFNGDLSKNILLNDKWMFGAGGMLTKQFTRVIGTRFKVGWAQLSSTVDDKYLPEAYQTPGRTDGKVHQKFVSYVIESDLQVTINWLNWILGYKPERLFSSYIIAGVGFDHSQGRKYDLNQPDDPIVGYLGYPSRKGLDNQGYGNNSGIGSWNLEMKAIAGLGFDFNLSKHWSINPEVTWRWRDGDVLDLTQGGAKQVKNDMYSGAHIGLTYKFAYSGCNLKEMTKRQNEVKYEVTPKVLVEKGDSVTVTVKGTFPPKYFCPKAGMYWEPVVTYQGGSYTLKPIHIMGEKLTGEGVMIKYKEGGSFTYTTTFPYKPEMNTSELVVAPIIYEAKEQIITKKDEIKAKVKYVELSSAPLAVGVIYTPTRIMNDETSLVADHGYQKEVIQSKTGTLYFKVNIYKLDLKFGINKTQGAKDALTQLNDFIKQGWKIKDIKIDGWASPEGEETFNANLSENRAKTGNTYMIDQFQSWVKDAEKGNKDKKAVKAKVEAAGKDVNFVIDHHGPDWNGFLKNVQASSTKDKDKILNVINSAGDNKKKEQEIRNMIVIYPDLEENLLPPLRRAEITADLYEPRKTDDEISKLAVSNPDQLKVEEILYAGTLTNNNDTKLTIYENAARVYPENWKALNNAGYANIVKGNLDKAGNYLQKAAAAAPNNGIVENNIGVVAAKNMDYKKAEAQFKKAQQLGENENYNLGVLMIPKGDYNKALSLLANAKCTYNLGLAQLVSGNTSAAETTLGCAPQTPDAAYLLAICGARTNNTKLLYDNLMKAVADPKLKQQAQGDREFYNYTNTQDFKNVVK
jgi:Flp pilus assembly protein TadD/outer membrane protein OmpA-like peptidoglycan-associated protein